ncbi:NAD-dependent epimerase/dehydratase family protein [Pseudoclavibacter sp. 13-3]|uniref:NAD-dependent epimerase/dehydratase family protein n=1 Tax=Pseudoclavibacter sp. 13-3 TaxID=2901228 RepID=UPI001E38A2CD|nr:NAD-dependent epimerase/dehydratase family protein [Pseudoclavibacter sp. 13-3]MCD7100705.1 NAD-dependent epimerase/dehydratase family protein [Pseudoclavibacter sp. 13-3]
MSSHALVIGAGPLGRATAEHLLHGGHAVTIAARHPLPADDPVAAVGAASARLDVTTPESQDAVAALRPDAIVACCNWPYQQWQQMWPRAVQNLIAMAERSDAVLVLAGNLYTYARTADPLREDSLVDPPSALGRVRASVWEAVRVADAAGRIRGVEIRGSDYFGPGAGAGAHAGDRLVGPVLAGRTAYPIGDPDQPHTWTAIADMGRLLARAAFDPLMWARTWHVPSAPACTLRDLATEILRAQTELEDRDPTDVGPRLRPVPTWMLAALGVVSPMLRQMRTVSYQFTAPFVMDDSAARAELGEQETPLAETVDAVVREHLRRHG